MPRVSVLEQVLLALFCAALPVSTAKGTMLCHPGAVQLADGCRHVYIDMGTNIGHQIRKLYEPALYPGNPTEPVFSKYFGEAWQRDGVCAFGFEASPVHEASLQRLERAFHAWGRRVRVFTSTAVSVAEHNVTFYTDPGAAKYHEWGASLTTTTLADKKALHPVTVPAIDMACWMKMHVLSRYVPPGGQLPPAVVMKSDIEEHDMAVLSHMLTSGVLCQVSFVYGEHMTPEWLVAVKDILGRANCTTGLLYMDDESGADNLPLPANFSGP
jgi:hypothetical protein